MAIAGLSLYTRHGVSDAERELGQRLVFDVEFELADCDAMVTDRVEDTVDYGEVVRTGGAGGPGALLQDARAPVRGRRRPADGALRRPTRCSVKATKPEPPIALPVDEVSVEVLREA